MKVLHITGSYPPTTHATGPPQQIHRLAQEMRARGVDVRVIATNADGPRTLDVPADRWIEFEGVPVFYGRRIPGTADLSWGAWRALHRDARRADLVHVTGIFAWINLAADHACRRRGIPVVVSPRGSLDPKALAFSPRKKALFLRLGGRRALERAAAYHVTSEMERDHVTAFVPGARTGLVPNAVVVPSDDDLARWRSGSRESRDIVYLGRIHPKKNLLALVRAWASVVPRHPGARLVIAGPDDDGHRAQVEREIAAAGLQNAVDMPGRVSGDDKSRLLARARCLVLPSVTENFGNVVAEALAHGTPVIASAGTPWSGLEEQGCGWWVDPTVDRLADAVERALQLDPSQRGVMAARGRRWMLESFSWPSVAQRMAALYLDVASRSGGSAG